MAITKAQEGLLRPAGEAELSDRQPITQPNSVVITRSEKNKCRGGDMIE